MIDSGDSLRGLGEDSGGTSPGNSEGRSESQSGGQRRGNFRRDSSVDSTGVQVGGGPTWKAFLERFGRAATSEASVLLAGEPGVGKGWLARSLHRLSPRHAGPLVEVDLSEGSASLVESLLFGHEAGAYTGASGARKGAARRAEGGTLVLRGVHDLDLALQVKLLRLLQERVVEPLGSEESIPVDVRVVTTAAGNLMQRVEQGTFREDLYYRMAVVVLEVPPLRVRFLGAEGWLPGLLAEAGRRVGRDARPLSEDAIQSLAEHPWPGNVLELENTLERVLVLGGTEAGGQPVQPSELDFLPTGVGQDHALAELARQGLALGVDADAWAGALLQQALTENRGRVATAARALGLTRKAFEYRLQRHREEQSKFSNSEGSGGSDGSRPDPSKPNPSKREETP